MAEIAELRALLLALAVEPRLRVGGRGVRLATEALTLGGLPLARTGVAGPVAPAALTILRLRSGR